MLRPSSSDEDWRRPPKDVPPGKLFRLLLRRPRPLWRLDYRLDDVPEVVLYARGLTAAERSAIRDADEAERDILFLWLALADSTGAQVFRSAEEAADLMATEVDDLRAALLPALRICSPSYDTYDAKAWDDVLKRGAQEPGSGALVTQIARSYDFYPGLKKPIPRPDRYFGAPIADITDGQRMAFFSAFYLFDR